MHSLKKQHQDTWHYNLRYPATSCDTLHKTGILEVFPKNKKRLSSKTLVAHNGSFDQRGVRPSITIHDSFL